MATSYKTPGVYVEEISKFPPSVAQVETAIPAFIGYTEKAEKDNDQAALRNLPTRIRSLEEYRAKFGEAPTPAILEVSGSFRDNVFLPIGASIGFGHRLFSALEMFFNNGGGPCYIVSVGDYSGVPTLNELKGGLDTLEKYDEPTLFVIPDAIALSVSEHGALMGNALDQCNKLQDRFAIIDVWGGDESSVAAGSIEAVATAFRGNVPGSHSKYGAAYFPFLNVFATLRFTHEDIVFKDSAGTVIADLHNLDTGSASKAKFDAVVDALDGAKDLRTAVDTALGIDAFESAYAAALAIVNPTDRLTAAAAALKSKAENLIGLLDPGASTPIAATNPLHAKITALIDKDSAGKDSDLKSVIETLMAYDVNLNLSSGIPAPAAPAVALAGAGPGNVDDGTHSYRITFVHAFGETALGAASTVVDVLDQATDGQVAISAIPTGPAGVSARKIYRTAAGDTGDYKLVGTLADNTTTVFTDDVGDAGLGAALPAVAAAGVFNILSAGADPGAPQPAGFSPPTVDYVWETTFNGTDYANAPNYELYDLGDLTALPGADIYSGTTSEAERYEQAKPYFDSLYSRTLNTLIAIAGAAKDAVGVEEEKFKSTTVYQSVLSKINETPVELPPGAAVAGIYARVDNNRGVWKAPANVVVSGILGPSVKIDDKDQASLNVDATSGKSINAIRAFTGKGTLIWGARTLAGNDNEWRYIPVRRFFNMVEESVKKATAFAVFEPNDANLWVKIKGMIENFLTTLWRQGALAGATTDQAFFVRVGLNETMTSLDILEGRMIVEIGMAAVRPAEFIILKFSHLMQQA
jgi:uncharacterized protein